MNGDDREAFNWIIGPAARAIAFVAEESIVAGTLNRSIIFLEGSEPLLRAARETLETHGADEAVRGIDRLLSEAPTLSKNTAKLKENDFGIVNSHSFIGVWGALEVAIEDTVTLVLEKDKNALGLVAQAGIKTNTFEQGPLSEEDAGRLYRRIESQLRRSLKAGEFYVKVLEIFGIDIACRSSVLSKLQEANSVRNCLLHRGGVIDDRAAESSCALRRLKGQKIHITQSRYLDYYSAVSSFLKEMLAAVIASPYTRMANEEEEV
ncbi:hypothetical protein QWI17_19890 [Gilvimarinus sp. SDUM040013]|uniref:RiboL-PSP-HEPN domain-containing protein n=1 Tax=Gilvimarinus gilvus TaxID=3058038 RepID=A0ABU4S3A4_9GAMM|nr:hypothetical protein [Gilvimarinus sp. SDUM040013]MDO3388117.1 hypothetical protein [Gilvimarinus sp. SDUM040013]MDX6850308.1 hypothetical protein [Gilvimarinus sp. SDUM040013]